MLTVVLASRDRAASLTRTLDAFSRLDPPAGGWCVLVVDNGSADDTPAVLAAAANRLPLRTLREARPGMSAALNAALPHLRGDVIVKADDDIVPDADWLVRYREAADAHPEAGVFGGTVLPDWPEPPPRWLWRDKRAMALLFALTEPRDGPCAPTEVFGPHWAIRHDILARGPRFAEDVGPDATNPTYRMGSESELFTRLAAMGIAARQVAAARVRHIIRPEQLTEAWILRRAYRCGLGAAAFRHGRPPVARRLVYAALARAAARLPPSRLRSRVMIGDRILAGLADSRRLRVDTAPPYQGA